MLKFAKKTRAAGATKGWEEKATKTRPLINNGAAEAVVAKIRAPATKLLRAGRQIPAGATVRIVADDAPAPEIVTGVKTPTTAHSYNQLTILAVNKITDTVTFVTPATLPPYLLRRRISEA